MNKKYIIITFFCWLFNSYSYSQVITIKGKISDNKNRGVESASVSIFDQQKKNVGYSFTDQNGNYRISVKYKTSDTLKIEISSLGYQKVFQFIKIEMQNHNFILEEKSEFLKEVVIESGKKIQINQDTTFIKVANFGNKTEQTVEEILKKLPGIVVKKDGTITAHGKVIDKLLIEGEDIFGTNYKILTRNLDAKVLEEVQIIDNFEDNPVFKELNNSDKVALNLKLKKGLSNVWFGNVTLGGSISNDNRWKESITLGLLKKKIKGFYFGDFNNLGEKSTDLISTNVNYRNNFSSDRFEYNAKPLYQIANNEIQFFSKTQSTFNKALLNSLSFSSKLKERISVRGVFYIANDQQFQNSSATTTYNLGNSPVIFRENNDYINKKTLASSEIELKFKTNEKNYITNFLIIKKNPNEILNNLLFNSSEIFQKLSSENYTFYNHFNHTTRITKKVVLNNYIYVGNDKIKENSKIKSPLLNSFLGIDTTENVNQSAGNKLFFAGIKSKLISKFQKIDLTNAVRLEYNKEQFSNKFLANNLNISKYENNTILKIFNVYQENGIRYNVTKKIDLTSSLNFQNSYFTNSNFSKKIFIVNPSFNFNIKKTSIGNFTLSYSENNTIPEINQLTTNFYLSDYRSFLLGTTFKSPLRSKTILLNYYFYNDEKRYSLNIGSYYTNSKSIINSSSEITDDFSFNSYVQTNGTKSYNTNISLVNYSRKLKVASKIENVGSWQNTPTSANSISFSTAKGFTNIVKYSGTTYFKIPINFDFSFSYNYFQSVFQGIKIKNSNYEGFLNINYKAAKSIIVESNNSMYVVNRKKYFFNNIVLSYNPIKSNFSFRIILNNLTNENQYTYISINTYTLYQSNIKLVPRYTLATLKYRF